MKKYIKHIILFAIIIAAIDFSFGLVCRLLTQNSKGGITEKIHYIITSLNEEVVIMGSSRAAHHYVSQLLTDSLGVTVYNAGFEGNGIIAAYGFLENILERHKPKVILYDLSGYDIHTDDNTKYLTHLKEHYSPVVRNVFADIDPGSPYKLQSNFYKYNSKFPRYIRDYCCPSEQFHLGYQPLFGKMKGVTEGRNMQADLIVDSIKSHYLKAFIDLLKQNDIKLAFVVSPSYKNSYGKDFWEPIKLLCEKEEIPFWNFEFILGLSDDYTNFQDLVHLNDKVALSYSAIIHKEIQSILDNI